MSIIINESNLKTELAAIDLKIDELNDKKITLLIESLTTPAKELPEDYLNWKTILIVVPNTRISRQLRQYKFMMDRIAFATNTYAQEIHIYDLQDWKDATRNKTQLEIKNMLKTSFGGAKSIPKQ